MALKGLEQHQESLQTTFNKTTGSGVAVQIALDKLKASNDLYSVSTQKVTTDQQKYNDAIDKYGKTSTQAQTAQQTLETAKAHSITTSESVLRAQNDYNKATGQTNNQLSTVQLAAQRLGVTLVDNKGHMTSQTSILMEMADAYTKTGGSVQTVADITAILGGRAKAVLPMFAQGSQGIQDAMKQTADAGLVMNDQQLKVGVTAGKTMNDIKENIKSLFVNLGTDLLPVFNFVDQHIKGFMTIAEAALGIFATVKLIKFASGFISDIGKLYSGVTGVAKDIGKLSSIGSSSGGGAVGKIMGSEVTVSMFGMRAYEQLKSAGGGGSNPLNSGGNLASTAENDTKDAGFLGMLGRIPGIGKLFGGAAAGTAEAGGMEIGGTAIGVGATAGIFAAALAPIALMFGNSMYTNSQTGDKAGATTGPTGGILSIPGLTSAVSVGGGSFANFFDAVHQNTTTVTVMGRKITSVSDNMHDVQGKADMQGFFNDISKMKGFSGITATQEQALATAVQNGTVNSQPELTAWLANNGIISQTSGTIATNLSAIAPAFINLQQTVGQTGPGLDNNINQIAGELKSTSGNLVNLPGEALSISNLMKQGSVTTAAQVATIEGQYTALSNATGGSVSAQAFLSDQLANGNQKIGGSVQSTIDAWKILVNEGANPATASAQQVAGAYKLAAADAALLHANLQADNNIPGVTLPNGKVIKYATGGMITEHVIGIGQKTGSQYHIGEDGSEAIVPLNSLGGVNAQPIPVSQAGGGGGGNTIVHVSFPNSLTFLNNANQIDELSKAIESRLATVRLPHRGVRMSPH
jgi:hypothetical protein